MADFSSEAEFVDRINNQIKEFDKNGITNKMSDNANQIYKDIIDKTLNIKKLNELKTKYVTTNLEFTYSDWNNIMKIIETTEINHRKDQTIDCSVAKNNNEFICRVQKAHEVLKNAIDTTLGSFRIYYFQKLILDVAYKYATDENDKLLQNYIQKEKLSFIPNVYSTYISLNLDVIENFRNFITQNELFKIVKEERTLKKVSFPTINIKKLKKMKDILQNNLIDAVKIITKVLPAELQKTDSGVISSIIKIIETVEKNIEEIIDCSNQNYNIDEFNNIMNNLTDIKTDNKNINEIRNKLIKIVTDIVNFRDELCPTKEKIRKLEEYQRTLKEQINENGKKIAENLESIEKLQAELNTCRETNNNNERIITNLNEQLTKIKDENDRLTNVNNELEEKKKEIEGNIAKINELEETLEHKNIKIQELNKNLEESKTNITELTTQLAQGQVIEDKTQLQELQEQLDKERAQHAELQEQLDTVRAQHAELQTKQQQIHKQAEHWELIIDAEQKKVKQLEALIEDLRQKENECNQLKEQIDQNNYLIEKQKEVNEKLVKNLADVNQKLKDLENQKNAEIEDLRKQIHDLTGDLSTKYSALRGYLNNLDLNYITPEIAPFINSIRKSEDSSFESHFMNLLEKIIEISLRTENVDDNSAALLNEIKEILRTAHGDKFNTFNTDKLKEYIQQCRDCTEELNMLKKLGNCILDSCSMDVIKGFAKSRDYVILDKDEYEKLQSRSSSKPCDHQPEHLPQITSVDVLRTIDRYLEKISSDPQLARIYESYAQMAVNMDIFHQTAQSFLFSGFTYYMARMYALFIVVFTMMNNNGIVVDL